MPFNYYVGYTPHLFIAIPTTFTYIALLFLHCILGYLQTERFFFSSMAVGSFLELVGFIGRWKGHSDPSNLKAYAASSFGLTVAPIFFMAAIYNTFGDSIRPLGAHYSVMKPIWYRRVFIVSDVISFAVQSAGGAMTSSNAASGSDSKLGTRVMTVALAFQVISMTVFMFLAGIFFYRIRQAQLNGSYEVDADTPEQYAEYQSLRGNSYFKNYVRSYLAATVLIYIRCIYRVVEMSQGFSGPTTDSEWWFVCFDMIPVMNAVILVTLFNPGIALKKERLKQQDNPEIFEMRGQI